MTSSVRIAQSDQTFDVADHESILDGALRAGVKLPHECTFGGCGTCRVKIHEGAVHYDEFPMALTEEEHDAGYALACQARCSGNVVIEPCAAGIEFPPTVRVSATVSDVQRLTPEITRLVMALPDDVDVQYVPGQYMNIVLPDGSTRSFSMASARLPDNQVDFHIRHIPGGYFTSSVVSGLRPGDTLQLDIPLGTFCYRSDDWRPMIMAATGTGIAPLRAILESLLDNEDCPPITFYWGMRTEADLYAAKEMASWASRLYEFNFIPVLSRPSEAWQGRRGYVQDAVAQDHEDLSEYAFYLCGSPDMIAQAQRMFCDKGADIDYIYSDSFTFAVPTTATV